MIVNNAALDIARDSALLHEIMVDLNHLVVKQEKQLESVTIKVDIASNDLNTGNKHLHSAAASNKKNLVLAVTLFIGIGIIILLVILKVVGVL